MVLIYWWVALFGIAIAGLLVVSYRKGYLERFSRKQPPLRVAHSGRITELPEYQKAKETYRRYVMVFIGIFGLALLAALLLGSRPASQSLVTPAEKNRDIMLCLDVSGSMTSVDTKLVETFEKLSRDFKGQRIGMDIFNVNVSQVFPLTDDYSLIQEQLAYAKKMLSGDMNKMSDAEKTDYYNYLTGTSGSGMKLPGVGSSTDFPSSNAGIGLAGCVRHLGENPLGRSQSVLLATDNELFGGTEHVIITTPQAMMLAKQKGVHVYSLDPGTFNNATNSPDPSVADDFQGDHAVLKNYTILTSGAYYRLSSVDIVPDIISQISKQEAKLFVGDSQYAASDAPLPLFIVLGVSFIGIVIMAWRLRL